MDEFRFTALGTEWVIQVHRSLLEKSTKEAILRRLEAFEDRFSRFRESSEVNAFRESGAGEYVLSEEMAEMLLRAQELRKMTQGKFDPALGKVLEQAGYDKEYSFEGSEPGQQFHIPDWKVDSGKLFLTEGVAFDFGGIGKGKAIDLVGEILEKAGHEYFLVDGGGDMYATQKEDGSGFRIALEWPGKSDTAFGVVELKYQGLAASDSFRRRWKKWHHIVSGDSQLPVENVLGAVALASRAWEADCATAALFQWPSVEPALLTEKWSVESIVFLEGGSIQVTPGWPGELFVSGQNGK